MSEIPNDLEKRTAFLFENAYKRLPKEKKHYVDIYLVGKVPQDQLNTFLETEYRSMNKPMIPTAAKIAATILGTILGTYYLL